MSTIFGCFPAWDLLSGRFLPLCAFEKEWAAGLARFFGGVCGLFCWVLEVARKFSDLTGRVKGDGDTPGKVFPGEVQSVRMMRFVGVRARGILLRAILAFAGNVAANRPNVQEVPGQGSFVPGCTMQIFMYQT